jgi:hypothetical protein
VIVSFKLVIELCNPAVIGSFEPAVIVCLVQASCDRPTSCDRLGYLLQARCDRLVQASRDSCDRLVQASCDGLVQASWDRPTACKPAVIVLFEPVVIVSSPAVIVSISFSDRLTAFMPAVT